MAEIKDGGPAFPERRATGTMVMDAHGRIQPIFETICGMSLRDWFAGQALAGAMASPHIVDHAGINKTDAEFVSGLAVRAYMLADAMLAERSKGGSV
jgi:hypothetical protein